MKHHLVAHQSISIKAPLARIWDALTKPEIIREYMFGTTVVSQWKPGATITWSGVWRGIKNAFRGKLGDGAGYFKEDAGKINCRGLNIS